MRFIYLFAVIGFLLYLATYLKFKNYIPILMYHRLADNPGDRNSLPPEKFEEQLAYLAANGYRTITPDEFFTHYNRQGDLPKKSVMITFDDAYLDTYTKALPLLQKYGMKAVTFPITDWIGSTNEWEDKGKALTHTMGEEELKAWLEAGMAVAPHSVTHPMLTACSPEQLAYELEHSKAALEKLTGEEMKYFCYPYGNVDKKVTAAAEKAGYKMGFAIFENVPLWNIDPMRLPRMPIAGHQTIGQFKQKIGKHHILLLFLRKWERSIKRLFK